MVELTILEEKLAVAWGLALAAITLTEKIERRTSPETLRRELAAMRDDARETQARCQGDASTLAPDRADELRARAQRAKSHAGELALSWLKAGTDAVGAWTLLAMGEAGEVAAWLAVEQLAAGGGDERLLELARWALPVHRRHLETALEGTVRLSGLELPLAPAIH